MTTPDEIVAYARTWLGARWKHQGRGVGRHRGIDCAGLLIVTAKHFGLPYGDLLGYRRNPSKEFVANIEEFTDPAPGPVNGSIGIFTDTRMPCHTGIFAEKDGFISVIHSECYPARRVIEQGFEETHPPLADRTLDYRLFRGVAY